MLFSEQTEKYRPIPRQAYTLPTFQMSNAEWESLAIPISLAFLFYDSSTAKVTAMYPSPAGATESLLELDTWSEIRAGHPALLELQPDVQAMLVNRVRRGAGRGGCFLVPIDQCFRLVGIIRLQWKGFTGGTEVWQQIDRFFTDLRSRARGAKVSLDA